MTFAGSWERSPIAEWGGEQSAVPAGQGQGGEGERGGAADGDADDAAAGAEGAQDPGPEQSSGDGAVDGWTGEESPCGWRDVKRGN